MKALRVAELERNAQIAYNIRKLRARRGMSQADLAQAIGVSQTLVALIETGARTLTLPLCMDMAEVLHCNVNELAGVVNG